MERTRPSHDEPAPAPSGTPPDAPPLARAFARTPATLAVIACIAALYFAADVLIPVAIAVLLAFVLAPAVRKLESWHMARLAAVVIVVGGFLSSVGVVGWVLQGQAVQLATDLPRYKSNITSKLAALRGESTRAIDKASTAIAEIGREISKPDDERQTATPRPPAEPQPVRVVDTTTSPIAAATQLLGPVASRLATAAIVVVLASFILIKREDLRNRLVRLLGAESIHHTTPVLDDAARRVSRYLWLQLVINTCAGLATGLGLAILGVPGALLWGCLMIALRFIPYVGAWVAAAFPILVSLAVAPDWHQPLLVAALITGVELTCGQIIEPLVFASGTGLSSIAVLLSAIFWGWLWGPVGLLLSTPIAVCLAVAGKHFPRLAFLDVLLSDRVALPLESRLYQRLLAGDPEEAGRIVAEFRAEKPTMSQVYDGLVIPSLRMAEQARSAGGLRPEQERSIREIIGTLIDDIGPDEAQPAPPGPMVVCVPARDAVDAAAAQMFAQVVSAKGIAARIVSPDVLTGELLEMIDSMRPPRAPLAVCISAVPPGVAMHARVIAKRIRARFPDLPVVLGMWTGSENVDEARRTLGDAGTPHVVTTLEQAVATVTALSGGPGAQSTAA